MFAKLSYLDRVSETCIAANKAAMSQSKGWDNKKLKNMKRYLPRGNAYKKVVDREWKSMFRENRLLLSDANKSLLDKFNTQ